MIEVTDWSREVAQGARAWIQFRLTRGDGTDRPPLRPVRMLTLDARIDGRPGITIVGDDLRFVTGLSMMMETEGVFGLYVSAVDDAGCTDATASFRPIVVTR